LESQDSEEDIINEFRKLDKENNGTISENDLRNLMSNYDNPLSDEEIEEIIQEANVDSNGNIDYINFTKILLGNL
jgi:Ca2+-binding EF-hand superfamily protein